VSGAFFIVAHASASEVMTWWSWEPAVIALLAITFALYTVGVRRPRRRARSAGMAGALQIAAFYAGWLSLVVALVSPLDALGGILFSAHMAQHEMLMVVAAPLLVLGRPLAAFLWAMPARWRLPLSSWTQRAPVAAAWRAITNPLVATVVHGIALWTWHLPALYEATLRSEGIHAVQHSSFLFSATLFWWALIHGRWGRLGYGVAVGYVFITAAHSGALGALITFAPSVLYPIYATTTARWGFSALDDQQLAGLIMWIPAGVLLTIAAVGLMVGWLAEAERRVALTSGKPETRYQKPDKAVVVVVLASGFWFLVSGLSTACSKHEASIGDVARGKKLVQQYGCTACHNIPGVKGPRGMVGPPLEHMAGRTYIAGKFQNDVQNMMRWLQNPQSMDPNNAMPNLGVTPDDSRDITAFLYTLK
jgi:putative membrane protein